MQKAAFGAGCFWGVEELFRRIPGVRETAVGYMGGSKQNPTYEEVCSDQTGHAEVVEVTFDSEKVSYQELLKVFWENHNPTTLNRQGPDTGRQYRSAIFYYHEQQKKDAEKSKQEFASSGYWKDPIVTEITPASTFWRAEEYHQRYLQKRGQGSCHL